MSAQLIIQHYLDKYETMANTLTDISFDILPSYTRKNPIYHEGSKSIEVIF